MLKLIELNNYGSGFQASILDTADGIVEIINIALMQLATVTLDNVEYGVNNTGGRAVIYFKDLPTR